MNDKQRILIVDDTASNIKFLYNLLRDDYNVSVAVNGEDALKLARSNEPPDLILLDVMMPVMDGYEVCRLLKENDNTSKIPVLFVTAKSEIEDESFGLSLGAVDYITKPISPPIVKARVRNQINLYMYREHLEEIVKERTESLRDSHIDTIYRLASVSEYKDNETGLHMKRISRYAKKMAEVLGKDDEYCELIYHASPMHDVGKVAIPDKILLKNGSFDAEEWEIMKTHALIGSEILQGSASPFLQMATIIAANHHECWDGSGYPVGLKGEDIPLAARIMNITDQYDALRSKRPYKESFNHQKSFDIITKGDGRTMPQQFDPEVLSAFVVVSDEFDDIYESSSDE